MTTFKPGDKVQITQVVTKESGWNNNWFSQGMDIYVNNNKTYTVRWQDEGGIWLKEIDFAWPQGALTLEENLINDGLTPIQRRCKKLWNESKYVKQNPQRAY